MKTQTAKLIKLICIFMCTVIILPCILVSCTDEEELRAKIKTELIGTWTQTVFKESGKTKTTWIFKPNYSVERIYSSYSDYSGEMVINYEGTYEIEYTGKGCSEGRWYATMKITSCKSGDDRMIGETKSVELIYNEDSGSLSVIDLDGHYIKQ